MSVLYSQNNLPVFQNKVYDTYEEAINCVKGNINIVEDPETGLIYNSTFNIELMNYDNTYNNEQANSNYFQSHLENVISLIEKSIGKDKLVEVGCGKGFFLEMLLKKDFDVIGFDPTYEGNNPNVIRKYFEPGLINKANGLILRHVLEHIVNPYEFLIDLSNANENDGLIYIEVPCFDWICQNKVWFDIFYEHVNYFRLSDFHKMFSNVIDSGRIFGSQYLYVIADLNSLRRPIIDSSNRVEFPSDFLNGLNNDISKPSEETIIWGGASKGVIFSLLKSSLGFAIDTVIDINPHKQGKFLPATGLKISSPDFLNNKPSNSTIHVMNSNYLTEIKEITNNKFNYKTYDND
jgi:hypothetical protein